MQPKSIRDEFAMAALSGMLMNNSIFLAYRVRNPDETAWWAYYFADAMLAEREKGKE